MKDKKLHHYLAVKVIYHNLSSLPQENSEESQEILNLFSKKVYQIYDLDRPLEDDCAIEFLDFANPLGQ